MPRTIGSLGSVALLVSSITGPSMVVIPLLFQQAGWFTPVLAFLVMALLSGTAALFVVETMSSIEGNEAFQASIEFTTIAHLFLGKRWHLIVQGLLYLAMQTMVIASLLESFQSMDSLLIGIAHKTCAISFTKGAVCVNQIPPNANSAFSGYILGSFGTLITLALILPLSLIHLVDNVIFQIISFLVLLIITVIWIVIFAIRGLDINPIPVLGHNQSTVVGFVLSNFAFVTTIPAWVNNTHPSVKIRRMVWLSVLVSCLVYIPIGWLGGLSFVFPNNATLLQVFATELGHGALATLAKVSSYIFPLAVLVTSVPVFTIVIRYNLLRGNICSYKWAVFWSAIFPWLVTIPFQTGGGLATVLNWASLVFTSPSNLLIPFVLFIVSKRHRASAILDATVSRANLTPPIPDAASEVAAPATPIATPLEITSPAETIPVVIITDATDGDPDSKAETNTLVSKTSGDDAAIPMAIMHRVSSPSRHRYYGLEKRREKDGVEGTERRVPYLDTASATSAASDAGSDAYLGSPSPSPRSPPQRRRQLSLSLSQSITHVSDPGMDEFLLISPTSPSERQVPIQTPQMAYKGALRTALSSPEWPRVSVSKWWGSRAGSPAPSVASPPPPRRRTVEGGDGHDVETGRGQGVHDRAEAEAPGGGGGAVAAFEAFPGLSPTSVIRPTRVSAVSGVLAAGLVVTAIVYAIVAAVEGQST